ncbi:MAG: hypothetical protein OSB03_00605 [Vicinamibacterales bacterium]|nr:hypothetical protein [Vicinamibacterales bacterium]
MMGNLFKSSTRATALVAAILGAGMTFAVTGCAGQGQEQDPDARPARTPDDRPNFGGVWQANNEAHWDLEAHEARSGMVMQQGVYPYEFSKVPAAPVVALGAAAGVPGSLGVVGGDGRIPYTPEALLLKQENSEHWIDRDPELKCYLPGIPRAMYMPYPFQIVQGTDKIHMTFGFSNAARVIHMNDVTGPPDYTYMGHSVGRWEGDTLVVEVSEFNGRTWFDRAGNFHSEGLQLTERFSPMSADAIWYEVTVTDPATFTEPWTIAMPIYRRLEPGATVLDYPCIEFSEEFMYGHLRREQLVQRWEGETMTVEITRKIPPGDELHEWYRR